MWRLFQCYYVDIECKRFRADLGAEQYVIVLFDGDSVLCHGYWSQITLQKTFLGFMVGLYGLLI